MDNKLSELKAAALAATSGPWELVYDDWSDGDDALISSESRDGMVAIAKVEGGGEESGYDKPFSSEQQANAAFIAAANPVAILALLAELEAKDKGGKLPEGFKLMPIEITDEIAEAIAMEARCCGGIALCIYEAALAAAPEGGND